MKKIIYTLFLFLLCGFLFPQQGVVSSTFTPRFDPQVKYEIQTSAGTKHAGYIIHETETRITLENRDTNETLELDKKEITQAREYRSRKEVPEVDPMGENYHAGNYLISQSAFEMEGGTAVANNHWILMENFQYSFTDNWAITSNVIAIYPLSFGLKCAYKIGPKSHLGFQGIGFVNLFLSNNSNDPLFLGYSALARYTYGTSNRNLSLATGVLGISSQLVNVPTTDPIVKLPFINGAFCSRINPFVSLVGEGWYVPGTNFVFGGVGAKLVKNENSCWSFGCYSLVNSEKGNIKVDFRNILIPYIGVSRKFN